MIAWPWNLVLTVAFVYTGLVCVGYLVAAAVPGRRTRHTTAHDTVVHLDHAVMSAGMILMAWIPVTVLPWLQIAVFTGFGLVLLAMSIRAREARIRIDLAGHVVLNAAMVWMVAAMPLLMADMSMGGMGTGEMPMGDMPMDGTGMAAMITPPWVDAVNLVFVVLSAGVALWQVYRFVTVRHHRLHASCHAVMGAGMAAMLVLMN